MEAIRDIILTILPVVILVASLTLWAMALSDWMRRTTLRNRAIWLVLIMAFPVLGSAVYLISGRYER